MITYQELYDLLRKEKYNEVLQPLPKSFLQKVADYLNEKKEIVNRPQGNLFSDTVRMTRKQLDNSLVIIKEIIALREKKILNLAFTAAMTGISKRDTESLLEHEQQLFEKVVKQLEKNQHELSMTFEGKKDEKKDLKNLFIRFKEEVSAFLDANGNELGPFKRGDVVNLSREIAKIFLEDKKADLTKEE